MVRTEKMTEYERQRLENIKRNDEMLAALKIHSRLSDLSEVASKRQRAQTKSYKRSPVKKPKIETPVVLRRSLRARGVPPDAATAGGLSDDIADEKQSISDRKWQSGKSSISVDPCKVGSLAMRDVYTSDFGSDRKLIETIRQCFEKSQISESDTLEGAEGLGALKARKEVQGSFDFGTLKLEPQNIARLVPGRIMSLRFFPALDMRVIAVGNKFGDIGFWNIDATEEDHDGIYVYHTHLAPISGIVIHPFFVSRMYSSCYGGFIRFMDVEKEAFDLVYSSEYSVYSMAQSPHDTKSLFFSEGNGLVRMWDVRAGKSSFSYDLHEHRINTIDFSMENDNFMATSSTDGTARIWDLRHMNADNPSSLKTVRHKRAVHSAYFSPSGKFLATTSFDDKVGIASGPNYEDTSMIYHYNQTNRWISSFRGIWGWDDSTVFIGNMKRRVDIISVTGRRTVATLESDLMSAIPCRFDAHPYNVGMLAGATSGGQVYIWTV